ncbi:MAG TPA: flagellar FlbD family protein [Candidatus Cybelea sp.]|jgi:flagellar protein FlbD|nr:flagellar FlbD family protein [Candidatus Cybelea sp.]
MITLTRENGQPVLLNCDLIETVDANGQSVITLTTGNAVVVRERPSEIEAKVVEYKRKIYGR